MTTPHAKVPCNVCVPQFGPCSDAIPSGHAGGVNKVLPNSMLAQTLTESQEVPKSAVFPLMLPEEVAAISVPASDSSEQLLDVFTRYGCALITDVLNSTECLELEGLWKRDLLDTIDKSEVATNSQREMLKRVERDGLSAWPKDWNCPLGGNGCIAQCGLPHGRFPVSYTHLTLPTSDLV